MAKVTLTMVLIDRDLELALRALRSASFCDEIIIVGQGDYGKIIEKILPEFPKAVIIPTTHKGTGDLDRQMVTAFAQNEHVLYLDADEYLAPELTEFIKTPSDLDVYFVPFINLVDGVDIEDILGIDYHPRFYKKGKVLWSPQLHTIPKVETPNIMFLEKPRAIVHDRTSEQIIKAHQERLKSAATDMQSRQIEMNFLRKLGEKLKKDLVKEVFGDSPNYSSI